MFLLLYFPGNYELRAARGVSGEIYVLLLEHKWVFVWGKFQNQVQKNQTEWDNQMAAGNQEVLVRPALIEDGESITMTLGSFVMGPHPNDLDDALLFYYLINQPVLYIDSPRVSAA